MKQYFEAIKRAAQKLNGDFSEEKILEKIKELDLDPNDFNYLFQRQKLVKTYYFKDNMPFIKIFLKTSEKKKVFSIVIDALTFDYDIETDKKELLLVLQYLKKEKKLPSIEDFDNLFPLRSFESATLLGCDWSKKKLSFILSFFLLLELKWDIVKKLLFT